MPESSTVRDHLANERTQLAWLRTSANVVVVGLAVARFADGGEVTTASLVALRYRRAAAAIHRGDSEGISGSLGPTVAAAVLLVAVLVSTVVLLATA